MSAENKLTPEKLDQLLDSFTQRPIDERTAAIQAVISGIAGNHTLKTVSVDVFTDIMLNNNMSSLINLLSLVFIMGQQHAITSVTAIQDAYIDDAIAEAFKKHTEAFDKDFLKNLKISLDNSEDQE